MVKKKLTEKLLVFLHFSKTNLAWNLYLCIGAVY